MRVPPLSQYLLHGRLDGAGDLIGFYTTRYAKTDNYGVILRNLKIQLTPELATIGYTITDLEIVEGAYLLWRKAFRVRMGSVFGRMGGLFIVGHGYSFYSED